MQSFNKFLNLDVYDNFLVYKVYGYKIVKVINLCINMYIICLKWN